MKEVCSIRHWNDRCGATKRVATLGLVRLLLLDLRLEAAEGSLEQ